MCFSFEQAIRQDNCPDAGDTDGTTSAIIIPTEINSRFNVPRRIMLSTLASYTLCCPSIQADAVEMAIHNGKDAIGITAGCINGDSYRQIKLYEASRSEFLVEKVQSPANSP